VKPALPLTLLLMFSLAGAAHARGPGTTSGTLALANLDHLIAQRGDDPAADELWLTRARFLSDDEALARGTVAADAAAPDAPALLRRAHARAALHRFHQALADLAAARTAGAADCDWLPLHDSIRIAQGAALEVLPRAQAAAAATPGFASQAALATAYAGAGRFADADRAFAAARAALDTTSPLPYAWLDFARGTMWAEQAGDARRGARFLRRALAYLPGFVAANLHLAEIEAARGETAAAEQRLASVAASRDAEVLALLGSLHAATDPARGAREIAAAGARFEELLAARPLAYADHAAAFYLGAGANPERARRLAAANLAERNTPRARALAERAARFEGGVTPEAR